MFNGQTVLAVIPARGGSKGIPKKNLSKVGSISLLELSVKSALSNLYVDKIVVSTDDAEIAGLAGELGCLVHNRSHATSADSSTAADVLLEVLSWADASNIGHEIVLYLQPTSPFRNGNHINDAFDCLADNSASVCISVSIAAFSPYKCLLIDEEGTVQSLFDESLVTSNRQSLPPVYMPNGAIYIFPAELFLKLGGFPIVGSYPLIMSQGESIDIDSVEDLKQANVIAKEHIWLNLE